MSKEIKYDFKSMTVSPRRIKAVIEGRVSELSLAFAWSETPQGQDFWEELSYGRIELDESVKAILADMAVQYSVWKQEEDAQDQLDARSGFWLEEEDADPTSRQGVLDQAAQCITVDRAATHGDAEDSFGAIAELWQWWLENRTPDGPIEASDVAMMMSLFKVGRTAGNPSHSDNYVDMLGYTALMAEMNLRK